LGRTPKQGYWQHTGAREMFWYSIKFQWKNLKWQYCTTKQTPSTLQVKDETGKGVTIPRLEPSEARRTIGV